MNPSIFKTYDVRGIAPDEINADAVRKITAALVEYLKPKNVALGYDARLFSKEFADVAKETFMNLGVDVYDLGMVPIEVLYFTCGHLKTDAGMMITASHNPREYNGIKIIGADSMPIGLGSGLEKIRDIALKTEEPENSRIEKPFDSTQRVPFGAQDRLKGKIIPADVWDDYLKKVFSFIDINDVKPIKIICDASNGVGGIVLKKIANKLPINLIELNFEPDGNFPNHEPNPMLGKNREQIAAACHLNDDISFAAVFDGDADRIVFLDESGKFIDTDYISAFITKILLNKNPSEPIVYDMRRGWSIKDQAESLGSKYYSSKSGYSFIRETMKKVNAIYGGEASAHNIYRDFYFSDSSMITFLSIVEYLVKSNQSLSQALEEYRAGHFMYEETNFEVNNTEEVFQVLEKTFSDGQKSLLDGLSIDYPDWHFNLRSSATQPLVRLNLEGKNSEIIEINRDRIVRIIEDHGGKIVEE